MIMSRYELIVAAIVIDVVILTGVWLIFKDAFGKHRKR